MSHEYLRCTASNFVLYMLYRIGMQRARALLSIKKKGEW